MALRDLIINTSEALVPVNDWLEQSPPDFFEDVMEILGYVNIGVASEMLEEIRTMLITTLTQALNVVQNLDIGQETLAETLNRVLLLGQLISALAGTVQGVSGMAAGLEQQLGSTWDFSALEGAVNSMQGFRDGFDTVLNQIPEPEDWAALDVEINRLQNELTNWINALQVQA